MTEFYKFEIFGKIALLPVTILGAYLINRILLYVIQRYLIFKKWLPLHFQTKLHFSKSMFHTVTILLMRFILPVFEFNSIVATRIDGVLVIALIISSTQTIMKCISLMKLVLYSKLDIATPNNLKERKIRTQVQFIEKLVVIFLNVIAISLILMSFEGLRKIGSSLIASAGLAGVILGFAAQKSLTNLLAGFQIAFTQPIRIDDVVVVKEEWGRIEEITLSYVVVRIWDQRRLIVPISYFIENVFQNWTRASTDLLGTVYLHVDYSLPLDEMRAEFKRILKSTPLWDEKTFAVQVVDSSEKTMQIRFLMSARNAQEAFDLRCTVREKLIGFIQSRYPTTLPKFRVTGSELNSPTGKVS